MTKDISKDEILNNVLDGKAVLVIPNSESEWIKFVASEIKRKGRKPNLIDGDTLFFAGDGKSKKELKDFGPDVDIISFFKFKKAKDTNCTSWPYHKDTLIEVENDLGARILAFLVFSYITITSMVGLYNITQFICKLF
jgi:hypothetical protein